jgi:hypothetical protein
LPMLLLAVASSLAGCLFEAPVDPTQEALDDNLIGAWRCLPSNPELDDETATFIVAEARDRVYSVLIEVEGEAPDRYEAHRSRIGDASYLNVRDLATNAPDKPWTLARYIYLLPNVLQVQLVEDDRLKSADLSPAALRQAIERGRADEFFGDYCVCVRAQGVP